MTDSTKYIVAVKESKDWHGYPINDNKEAWEFYHKKQNEGFLVRMYAFNEAVNEYLIVEYGD